MDILTGLLYMNDVDAYAQYGVFLSEEKEGDTANYDALLLPPKAKSHTAVSFREEDGERHPEELLTKFEARDVVLQFAIEANNKTAFFNQRSAFMNVLKSGRTVFRLTELGKSYTFIYKEATKWSQLTHFEGKVYATFNIKFREPQPTL